MKGESETVIYIPFNEGKNPLCRRCEGPRKPGKKMNCENCPPYSDAENQKRYKETVRNTPEFKQKTNKRNKIWYKANREKAIADVLKYRQNNLEKIMFGKARQRAVEKHIPFTIELSDIVIPSICPVLGIPLFLGKGRTDNSPSLDRMNGALGYVKGNIAVISLRANRVKNDATVKEHELIVAYMKGL